MANHVTLHELYHPGVDKLAECHYQSLGRLSKEGLIDS